MLSRRGLTMIELFVVLAIISILLALFLPAVHLVRERARETTCKNNIHQINLAMVQYAEVHKELPAPSRPGSVGGWMVAILPFIEQQNLKDTIADDWLVTDAPEALFRPPSIFRCPRRTVLDDNSAQVMWPGHYVFVPASRRKSFLLFDAPINLQVPWVNGPEMAYSRIIGMKGPHSDGFHFAKGFQQGVGFMLGGEEIR